MDAKDLHTATVADSDKVRVGEWVVAVGDPLGVGTTVTAGIVSAIRKNEATGKGTAYASLIQTDAAINPGNSGGALADIEGRLIGINSAIRSNTGGSVGIGYAIPSNTMREITSQLIEKGHVSRPWLGVSQFATLTERGKAYFNMTNAPDGVIIGHVQPGSPAESMGLHPNDLITKANNKDLKIPNDLLTLLQSLKVGDALTLNVWRGGFHADVKRQPDRAPRRPVQPEHPARSAHRTTRFNPGQNKSVNSGIQVFRKMRKLLVCFRATRRIMRLLNT